MVRLNNKNEPVKEATAQFRLVAWATGSAIWDWDLESGEFWSSPGHQRLFGRGEDELVEHFDIEDEDNPWAAHHHLDDRNRVVQAVRDHLEHDTPYDIEYRYRLPSGAYIWIHSVGRAVRNSHGQPIRMVGTNSDITARKQAEVELREREERRTTLADLSQDLIWIFTDGVIVDCNDYAAHALGMESQEELVGTSVLSLLHPDYHEMARLRFAQLLEQGVQTPSREIRLIRADGTVLIAETKACPYSYRGKPSILAIARDITERKNSERALLESEQAVRASEALYRNILDNMVDTFFRTDKEGSIVMASASVDELLGYSSEELIGRNLGDLYAEPDGRDTYIQAFKESGGNIRGYEIAVRHKDGHIVWVSTNSPAWMGVNGEVLGIEGTARDTTLRKQAEMAFQESEERFRGIIENSPAAIFLKDLEGRFQLVNSKFEEWYGVSAAEVIGKTSHDIYPKEFADLYVGQDQKVIAADFTCERERDIPFADDTLHTIIITKFPVRDGTGKVVGVGTINTDVTAQREAQERLRQSQKMEAVGQLTGGIAHDFNNLLAVIMGNLELIGDHVEGNGAVNEIIERGLKASERGATLTQRLLSFSRKQALLPTPIDLNKLILDMLDMLSRSLGETIEIHCEGPPDLWQCRADQSQLENAILNMSINSRDAMPDGGVLMITTVNFVLEDEAEAAQLELEPGRYAMLSVSDTGTGIAEEALSHVFEPFFTTKDVGKGSGLGLSMVYGFAKQSGGAVHIDSEIETAAGTVIKIYLPALAEQANEAADAC